MKRILFICLGNICRSPMAEFIFKNLLEKENLSSSFEVCSRATSYEEEGNPVYPPAAMLLRQNGILCQNKRAKRIEKGDYEKYDLFVCMEERNVRDTLRIFGSDKDNKVVKLLDFTPEKGDIADPYYTRDFALTYRQIEYGCQALLRALTEGTEATKK